ncbi:MAG: hypothetical protein B0D92_07440 [Spirochaeta sp. LUC14_002_19_P3]|nr:MAG: hypothetical protein B0D92_07440 [Spirochaeta sp. LUC14_002_19_P3]
MNKKTPNPAPKAQAPPNRDAQAPRPLSNEEISLLEQQGNRAESWRDISVGEGFQAERIHGCRFLGKNYIGGTSRQELDAAEQQHPIGLYNSLIIGCHIAGNAAIHNVRRLANIRVEARAALFNIGEISTEPGAEFGAGTWMKIANENGGRSVQAVDGMLPADAWLWAKYRGDEELMQRFAEISRQAINASIAATPAEQNPPGGIIGAGTIIQHCGILRNLRIGPSARIEGSSRLQNLSINSSPQAPTIIEEACTLSDGIISHGCRINSGASAQRFVLGEHSTLELGACLTDSVLGPNSRISCGEVRCSLLFYTHSQPHKSSFLCAAVIKGMSNLAAAAAIGSNHNSRVGDGEISAERGFWPGLGVSLVHNSRFAAFTLIAKGAYPAQLDIPLPFCLLSNSPDGKELRVMPGYWFQYNLYGLARDCAKTAARDARTGTHQPLEYHWLAPDTAEQMLHACKLLEQWESEYEAPSLATANPTIMLPPGILEASSRPIRILHAGHAYRNYLRLLRFYAVQVLLTSGAAEDLTLSQPQPPASSSPRPLPPPEWDNIGGQLIKKTTLETLKTALKTGRINDWPGVHRFYAEAAAAYPAHRRAQALQLLRQCAPGESPQSLIREALATAEFIHNGISASRRKDYESQFRNHLYSSEHERDAVLGHFDADELIAASKQQLDEFRRLAGFLEVPNMSTA